LPDLATPSIFNAVNILTGEDNKVLNPIFELLISSRVIQHTQGYLIVLELIPVKIYKIAKSGGICQRRGGSSPWHCMILAFFGKELEREKSANFYLILQTALGPYMYRLCVPVVMFEGMCAPFKMMDYMCELIEYLHDTVADDIRKSKQGSVLELGQKQIKGQKLLAIYAPFIKLALASLPKLL